jgi:hypothetical protein
MSLQQRKTCSVPMRNIGKPENAAHGDAFVDLEANAHRANPARLTRGENNISPG